MLRHIKAKILIIDDDPDTRRAVQLTLESGAQGSYTFKKASTVAAGLKITDSFKPDAIILDLHLPGKNGFDFLESLGTTGFPKSKIVLLTADNTLKNLWEAEAKGVNAFHFIGKPFEGDELRALIISILIAHN